MFSCISDEVRDDVLEHMLLCEVLVLQAVSPVLRNRLLGACDVIRICLEEASYGVDKLMPGKTPTVVDRSHGTDVEEPLPPTSFLKQPWSRRSLEAKVAIAEGDYEAAGRELLLSRTASPMMLHVRRALGAAAQLVQDIRIERLLDFPVPARTGGKVRDALLAGQILGLAGYEHRSDEDGWAGTSMSWTPGWLNNTIYKLPEQVEAHAAERFWDIGERSGFKFADASDRLTTFAALPAISGLFEEELSIEDLTHLSDAARISLRRLGRLRVPSAHVIDSAPIVYYPQLEYLSIQLESFSAGTAAWPVVKLSDGTTQPVLTAQVLAEYLSKCFPGLRSAHVFVTWDAGWHKSPAPNYAAMIPRPNLVDLSAAFLVAWSSRLAHALDVTVEFQLWNMCFDGIENVASVCNGVLRQAAIEAYVSYLEDELDGVHMRRHLSHGLGACHCHHPEVKSRDLDAASTIRGILVTLIGREEADRVVDRALEG